MKRSASLIMLAFSAITVCMFSCKKSSTVVPPTLSLATNATVGQHLVDKEGYTLYFFSNDADSLSNCTGGCLNLWPIYYEDLTGKILGDNLALTDFATITTAAGAKQTTYKGWPLYYYAPLAGTVNTREKAGDIGGEGFGNVWFVAKPDYTLMIANFQMIGGNGKTYKNDYTEGTGRTNFFITREGATIYSFKPDSAFKNKFTRSDFGNNAVWPIVSPIADITKMVLPSTIDKTQFTTIDVFGRSQLTYKGWPLYNYGPDNGVRSSAKGVSVGLSGTIPTWPVVIKDALPAPR